MKFDIQQILEEWIFPGLLIASFIALAAIAGSGDVEQYTTTAETSATKNYLISTTPLEPLEPLVTTTEEVAPIFEETTTELVEASAEDSELAYRIDVSESDIALMARVVMSEASRQSYDCKVAIAETIINRLLSDKYPDTIAEVIYQDNQFSTQDNGAVNEECYKAVNEALTNQRHPSDMYYFRTGKWHSWAIKYCKIDTTYFSTARSIKE